MNNNNSLKRNKNFWLKNKKWNLFGLKKSLSFFFLQVLEWEKEMEEKIERLVREQEALAEEKRG
jgi:hypothetical protein